MTEYLTKDSFIEKIFDFETKKEWEYKGELPAIIDFYADWCGPCKMVTPVLESLSNEYEGKLKVYKVNTDKEPELSAAFGIQSIPSFLFIPVGNQPQMAMGALPKATFQSAIKDVLGVAAQA
ncbi:MAG: thioredoxin [Spirochaetales bacterium]|jgi:thioredoxin